MIESKENKLSEYLAAISYGRVRLNDSKLA